MLDENTGYLVTGQRHLDREAQSQHELYIQACDQERLCSSVLVVVNVSSFCLVLISKTKQIFVGFSAYYSFFSLIILL
jgi:hypothetical protein